jgi:hypothetical protein
MDKIIFIIKRWLRGFYTKRGECARPGTGLYTLLTKNVRNNSTSGHHWFSGELSWRVDLVEVLVETRWVEIRQNPVGGAPH